jgi:hypothetical protein
MLGRSTSARRQDAAEFPVSLASGDVLLLEEWTSDLSSELTSNSVWRWARQPHPPYSPDLSPRDFFSVSTTEKKAKRTATWEYRGYSSGCVDGAHRHSERGIHQLLSGLAETLATVYWLRRELLRRGQEALVVRLNFVFFTDSVSELYGQRMYSNYLRVTLDLFSKKPDCLSVILPVIVGF